MKKLLLLTAAILLFAFYNYGFFRWLQSHHNFSDVWRAVRSDWFLSVTVLDMGIFSLLCLIWLWRDMHKRSWPFGKRVLMLLATLVTGVVVPLLYLAFRRPPGEK
jgi:hypothetical protein